MNLGYIALMRSHHLEMKIHEPLTTFTIEIIHLTAEPGAEHPRLKKTAFQFDFKLDICKFDLYHQC